MNKKITIGLVLVVAAIALSLGFVSCDKFFSAVDLLIAPTASVINAKTGAGIADVVVTLTAINLGNDPKTGEAITQTAETGTSDADGAVIFANSVEPGKYEATAVLTGYVFIPVVVDIAGWNQAIPEIWGIQPTNATDVSVFLTWDTTADLDAYLTYPTGFEGTGPGADYYGTTFSAYHDFGYNALATPVTEARDTVYYSAKNAAATNFAYLDVDDTDGIGPETVTLNGVNTGTQGTAPTITVSASSPDGLGSVLTAGTYYWLGFAEYYLDSFTGTLTTASTSTTAGAVAYITQGTSVIGKYEVPLYTGMNTVSLFRAHLLYDTAMTNFYLVFYPDVRSATDTSGIRGLDGIPTNAVVVASGSK